MTQAVQLESPPVFEHITVLLREVTEVFASVSAGWVVDVTLGGGGHTEALLKTYPHLKVLGCDRDEDALAAAKERLAGWGERIAFEHASFEDLPEILARRGLDGVVGIIADLGVSSPQLDRAERGMSFRSAGPLDMRMDQSSGQTARELIEELEAEELADVLYELGEERASRRIARCIKQASLRGELETTLDLRRAVVRAVGPRRAGGVDPATRTFQALRIAVNRELEQLDQLLLAAPRVLVPGGIMAAISFHSLEDRRVKRAFLLRDSWERLTKKALIAAPDEQASNPRARSAKLRIARRWLETPETYDEEYVDSETPPPVRVMSVDDSQDA